MTDANINPKDQREFKFTDENFQFIVELINKQAGIVLSSNKKSMVYSRLARRLRKLGLNNFDQYCDFLASSNAGTEIENFMNSITTNLTSFFRESHHFDHLKTHLDQIKNKPRLRIWSTACSTGQEPYSIAAVLAQALRNKPHNNAKILATDIDTKVLETAKNGIYDREQLDKIPVEYQHILSPNLSPNDDTFAICSKVKDLIAFNHLNLLDNWPISGKFDIIFCRNVVIYFDKETQDRLFNKLADHLEDNGILYIGHSEHLHEIGERFRLVGKTTYQRIK